MVAKKRAEASSSRSANDKIHSFSLKNDNLGDLAVAFFIAFSLQKIARLIKFKFFVF